MSTPDVAPSPSEVNAARLEMAAQRGEVDATIDGSEMIGSGAVKLDELITDRLPVDRVHDAIKAVEGGTSIKVVIEP